jgi:hypothetical protein
VVYFYPDEEEYTALYTKHNKYTEISISLLFHVSVMVAVLDGAVFKKKLMGVMVNF